ncbi:hypothetical protein MSIM_46590 [Mycobacterium simiae]|nr:hypothetical protein MSIM_46590 [Mycobacterium simiae]
MKIAVGHADLASLPREFFGCPRFMSRMADSVAAGIDSAFGGYHDGRATTVAAAITQRAIAKRHSGYT